MPPVKVPELNKWTKPPTAIYENNYGYGINYYQPMIDYITAKEQGSNAKPPHLPWNNERGLEKYRFDKPVKTYSENDVLKLSQEVSERAKRDLNTFNVGRRTPFTVVATAAATNLSKHVGVKSVSVKTRKKKVEKENIKIERQSKRDDLMKSFDLYNAQLNAGAELKSKATIYRGKSAKAIAQTLLEETRNKVGEGKVKKIDVNIGKYDSGDLVQLGRVSKNVVSDYSATRSQNTFENKLDEIAAIAMKTPKVCVVQIETEIPTINTEYVQKINELKQTINQFEQLNTSLVYDQRYNRTGHSFKNVLGRNVIIL